MRNFTSNPARIIIKEAVKAARNDKSTFNPQMDGSVTPSSGTTYSTDDDGIVTTQHVMMWDFDNWDDEESVWA